MQSIRSLCATAQEISDDQKIQCVIIFWAVKNYNCSIQKSFMLNLFFFYTKLLRWFLVLYWKDLDWSIPLLKTALKCDQREADFVSFVSKSKGCHPKTSFPHSPLVKMENYVPIWKIIASTFLWLEGFKCLYQLLCPHQWVWPCGL